MSTGYPEVLALLERAQAELRPVPQAFLEGLTVDWLRARPFAAVKAADMACEALALEAQWPPIRQDEVVVELRLRLQSALALCRGMAQQPVPDHCDRRQLVRMLLLDYWHERARQWTEVGP